MSKVILVMGLPSSGKSTISLKIAKLLDAHWLNNDIIRKEYSDWDFSLNGRLKQAERMLSISQEKIKLGKVIVADFVCPTRETRKIFNPDYVVWMDTIKKSLYKDTNLMFEPPLELNVNFIVKEKNAEHYSKMIFEDFKKFFKIKD